MDLRKTIECFEVARIGAQNIAVQPARIRKIAALMKPHRASKQVVAHAAVFATAKLVGGSPLFARSFMVA